MIKAPTEDGEPVDRLEVALQRAPGVGWSADFMMNGNVKLSKPGWELVEITSRTWQAIAISSRYRFTGSGSTPTQAMASTVNTMTEFGKELAKQLDMI